jgi:hypothetical protein
MMTKKEYIQFHADSCEKMKVITAAKNADYTGVGDDPFANFSRVSAMGICSTEQGFLVRMNDKMSRLSSFIQRGILIVKDESLEDTCLDLANYAILLAAYIKSRKAEVQTDHMVDEEDPSVVAKRMREELSTRAANARAP